MARNNNRLLIPIIAGLGLLALLGTLYALFGGSGAVPNAAQNAVTQAPVEQPQSTQYVAARDISPRTPLTRDLFREAQVDAAEVPSGAITELGDLTGRLANRTIRRGEVVTQDATIVGVRRVIPASFPVPAGARAIAIYVNPDQTAAGLVDVGDRVDVIATHKFNVTVGPNQRNAGASGTTTGRVIAQNLYVLAVDKSLNAPPPAPTPVGEAVPGAGAPPSPGGAPGAPAAAPAPTPVPPPGQDVRVRVLLAAPIEVAARLVAAQEEGKLHIAIRNPASADQFPVPEVREYPTRIVQNPIPRAPGAAGGGSGGAGAGSGNASSSDFGSASSRRASRRDADLAPPVPSLPDPVPPASVPSFPTGGAGTGGAGGGVPGGGASAPLSPAESSDNEVTVIRGTEKTRVLVPR